MDINPAWFMEIPMDYDDILLSKVQGSVIRYKCQQKGLSHCSSSNVQTLLKVLESKGVQTEKHGAPALLEWPRRFSSTKLWLHVGLGNRCFDLIGCWFWSWFVYAQ